MRSRSITRWHDKSLKKDILNLDISVYAAYFSYKNIEKRRKEGHVNFLFLNEIVSMPMEMEIEKTYNNKIIFLFSQMCVYDTINMKFPFTRTTQKMS